ncbi:hypothetical protein ACJX0J_042293, partial [Zea mays]
SRVACFLLHKISGRKMALPQWKSTASVKSTATSRIHSCAPLWLLTSTSICEKLSLPTKKRPSTDFMETIQKDINPSMREILIDWLVEVAEEYRLAPGTLCVTVNYIDRYLSGNEINRRRLQLLGVACMLEAA